MSTDLPQTPSPASRTHVPQGEEAAGPLLPGDLLTRAEIDSLRAVDPWRSAFQVVHCWATILLVWVACAVWTNPLTILLGVMIVGTRQLGLGILNHDAAHYLLFRHRGLNDWAAEWLLSRPLLGAGVANYRKVHLLHHRFTQQANDPDLHLSAPFPITRSSFWRKVLRDLTGQTAFKQVMSLVRGVSGKPGDPLLRRLSLGLRRLGPNLLINLAFLAGFAVAGVWYLYFLLWVLPEFTWRPLITRIRNIGEHAVVPDNDDRLRNTRTTLANRLERLLVAPYFVNYHLEHHLLVSAPCYRLPRMHALLVAKGLLPRMEVQPGYLAMLRLAVSRPEADHA